MSLRQTNSRPAALLLLYRYPGCASVAPKGAGYVDKDLPLKLPQLGVHLGQKSRALEVGVVRKKTGIHDYNNTQ